MSPLTTDVCPLELEDDIDGLVSMVHVESSDNYFNDDDNAFGMNMSSDYDVDINMEVFEVSKAHVSTHPARYIELIDDHIPMATKVKYTFNVE